MEIIRISKSSLLKMIIVLSLHVLPCLSFTSFVFGDSLVDSGNNDYLFTLSKADSPPYGIDFTPSGGKPTGRFTNGRTITDLVDQALGAKSFPPPYLAPNTRADAIQGGLNYASGASGILDETGSLFIGRVTLRKQVNYFEQSRTYMVNVMGENSTEKFLKKAIFSLTIGSNDILNYIQPSIPFFGEDKVSHTMFQDFMVSNLTVQLKVHINCRQMLVSQSLLPSQFHQPHDVMVNVAIYAMSAGMLTWCRHISELMGDDKKGGEGLESMFFGSICLYLYSFVKRLHGLGARKFVVVGIGPVGCIPIVRALKLLPSGRCSVEVNALIRGYNKKMREMLDQLNQEMGPEAIFVYANSYDIVMGIILNYRQYGFENANDPCCGGSFPPFVCFKGDDVSTSSVLCDDRSKYVFWDSYHPTEAANLIVADKLLNGDESFSSPMNIRELYNYYS